MEEPIVNIWGVKSMTLIEPCSNFSVHTSTVHTVCTHKGGKTMAKAAEQTPDLAKRKYPSPEPCCPTLETGRLLHSARACSGSRSAPAAITRRRMGWYKSKKILAVTAALAVLLVVLFYSQLPGVSVVAKPYMRLVGLDRGSVTPTRQLYANVSSERWIVVTTIAPPTADVKFLASVPGWKVVVVGDSKTPRDWSYKNCYYLSLEDQAVMGLKIFDVVPTKTYARKNLGYLFAIQHGAKVIYETDDDNRPTDRLKGFALEANTSGLKFVASTVFNPYWHFGQKSLWPRGYPLSAVGTAQVSKYVLGTWNTPSIQQGVVNGDPDMDAIFRLTRKVTTLPLNVTFDPTAPNVILPPGVFSPFNSQNTLFRYDAFWALLLPTTVSFRVCDIWRSYWAQRLLWEIGGTMSFVKPNAFQARNAHEYLADAMQERQMYWQTPRFISFLTNWTCPRELSFFDCVIKMSRDMVTQEFWKEGDVTLVTAWLEDLVAIGYKSPPRIREPDTRERLHEFFEGTPLTGDDVPFDPDTRRTRVVFHPKEMTPPLLTVDLKPDLTDGQHLRDVRFFQNICKNISFRLQEDSKRQQMVHPRTTLIVEFNFSHYQGIPHLIRDNRHRYPTMLFCGDNIAKFLEISKDLPFPATFVEAGVSRGRYGYECTMHAISMGYDVDDYLYVSDDVMINPSNLPDMSGRSWTGNVSWEDTRTAKWVFWHNKFGVKALHAARQELAAMAAKRPDLKALLTRVDANHRKYVKANFTFMAPRSNGDVYQVSSQDARDFLTLAGVFRKHGVFLEIAVPTILSGLQDEELLQVKGVWAFEQPLNTNAWLTKKLPWLHPVKWRLVMKDKKNLEALCKLYFSRFVDVSRR